MPDANQDAVLLCLRNLQDQHGAMQECLMSQSTTLSSVSTTLERMERDVANLVHTVHEGNGQPSLVAQVSRLADAQKALKTSVDSHLTTTAQVRRAAKGHRRQVMLAVGAGILSLITSLLAVVAQVYLQG